MKRLRYFNLAPSITALALAMLCGISGAQSTQGTSNTPESLIGVEQGIIPGVVWNGTALSGFTGRSCSSAGDVDADGYSDILVGVPSWDNILSNAPNIGQAYLIFGTPTSFGQQPDQPLNPANPAAFMIRFIGAETNNQAGFSVSGAGDVNGDGYADFLISAPGYKENSGMVYLIYGAPRYLWTQTTIALGALNFDPVRQTRIFGGAAGIRAGWSVSGAGDVNGDGFDDIIIGIPFGNGAAGEAVVLFGKPGQLDPSGVINLMNFQYGPNSGVRILGFNQGSTTGWSVSGVSDFNFDGQWDVLIGAPYAATVQGNGEDAAYLVYGSALNQAPSGVFNLADISESTGLNLYHSLDIPLGLGYSVSGIGDFNADGIADIAIGSPLLNQGRGGCFVIFGNLTNPGGVEASLNVIQIDVDDGGLLFTNFDGLRAGFSVAGAGDTNNDGIQDLLIGGPGINPPGEPPNPNATRAWLVYGAQFLFSDGILDLDFIDADFQGKTFLERNTRILGGMAGFSVAGAGDFNRDNTFDLLIGAPGEDRCYLLLSPIMVTPFGYQILARNSDTPPLPVGILGDGSHALPLTRSWIDFNSGNMDPETTPASVSFYSEPYTIFPYLNRTRYSWSVSAFRNGVTDTKFIVKGTRTFGASAWYDALLWSEGGTEYNWLNMSQNRDPQRTLIQVEFPSGFESYVMGAAPSLEAPRIERAILVDDNDNGVADSGEQLVLVFTRAINYIGFLNQNDFHLPVDGDSLGTTNFNVQDNPANFRQLLLTLGDGVNLTIPDQFDDGTLTPGSPSGIDLIVNPQGSPDVVSEFGVPAIDNGVIGETDTGVDILYDYVGMTMSIGAGGGIIGLLSSKDAAFNGHQLSIPPNAIPSAPAKPEGVDPVFQIGHPPDNLGVLNAVQIMVDRDSFSFTRPARLRLQFLDSEIDHDNGFDKRATRIFQLSKGEWIPVPGPQIVDIENNYVEVSITALDSILDNESPNGEKAAAQTLAGPGTSVGIFGNIFGETVEEATFNIKPTAGGAAGAAMNEIGLMAAPILKPGTAGSYTLHEIEFPGYEIADPSDPERIQIKIRKPTLFDIYSTHGDNEIPGDVSSYFIIETRNALSQFVPFTSPVNFKIQFFDKSINTYDDRFKFDGSPGNASDMTLFADLRDGDDNEYDLVPNIEATILPADGGGLVQVTGVSGLTGTGGSKLWGAISTDPPPPPDVQHGWMLR